MKKVFQTMLTRIDFPDTYRMVFWDGDVFQNREGDPLFTIHFKTKDALHDMLVRSSLGFGESYMNQEIEIDGDLQNVSRLGFALIDGHHLVPSLMERLKIGLGFLLRKNTIEGSRKNISAHYDLGNDFYRIWLDDEMQYTCAYFESPHQSLERAQRQKMDLVCRKLRLQPGDNVVEAGCGWGHFALYAAQNYGVRIRSFNISKEQIEHARDRAKFLGIGPRQVEYVHDDYRSIAGEKTKYDKFVSIGMLEHVGRENYATLYDIIHKSTKENALAMVHTIGRTAACPTDPWLEKHIFPGGYIPSLSEITAPMERMDRPLYVADVENLRYHYALTLDHWSDRFEQNVDAIRQKYGEAFVRKFRLYLRGSAAGFRYGGILLFQVLLSNGYDNNAPLTRHHFFHGLEAKEKGREKKMETGNGHNGNGHRAAGVSGNGKKPAGVIGTKRSS